MSNIFYNIFITDEILPIGHAAAILEVVGVGKAVTFVSRSFQDDCVLKTSRSSKGM